MNKNIGIFLRRLYFYRVFAFFRDFIQWVNRQYSAPSPYFIKKACLIRNGLPNSIWVETGTYLGETTEFISRHASKVYSIEPEPILFQKAKKYFKSFDHISILHGTSENIFPILLPKIKGNVNFWLDGHYSDGVTYQGSQDTPIIDELKNISKNLKQFKNVTIFIDDIRCFQSKKSKSSSYPSLDYLVRWAKQEQFLWHIEHDIFIAKKSV